MLEWKTIIASIVGATTISGAIIFLAKKMFEKGIETKFKEIENRQRLILEEASRRRGKLFDDQYDFLKKVLTVIYRTRNELREMLEKFNLIFKQYKHKTKNSSPNISFNKTGIEDILNNYILLDDLLKENRAIAPAHLFDLLHQLRNSIHHFHQSVAVLNSQSGPSTEEIDTWSNKILSFKKDFQDIDNMYIEITKSIHAWIGVEK